MEEIKDRARREEEEVHEQRVAQEIQQTPSVVLALARVSYAVCGGVVTFLVSDIIKMPLETSKELAILNAGVAYYTHDAAGKVVNAINALGNRMGRSRR